MKTKPNVLVVCGRNKRRSKTAEAIFRKDERFNIQSAGLSPRSPSQISDRKIDLSDVILVMEDGHKSRILDQFRHLDLPDIHVLQIEDVYEYMDAELVAMLESSVPETIAYLLEE